MTWITKDFTNVDSPVPQGTIVEVELNDGMRLTDVAELFTWDLEPWRDNAIKRYRIKKSVEVEVLRFVSFLHEGEHWETTGRAITGKNCKVEVELRGVKVLIPIKLDYLNELIHRNENLKALRDAKTVRQSISDLDSVALVRMMRYIDEECWQRKVVFEECDDCGGPCILDEDDAVIRFTDDSIVCSDCKDNLKDTK